MAIGQGPVLPPDQFLKTLPPGSSGMTSLVPVLQQEVRNCNWQTRFIPEMMSSIDALSIKRDVNSWNKLRDSHLVANSEVSSNGECKPCTAAKEGFSLEYLLLLHKTDMLDS